MPDFHGYGYNAWAGGPGSGFHGLRSRGGVFHAGGSGSVGIFGGPMGPSPSAPRTSVNKAASHGTVSGLEPLGGIEWGKGTAAIGKVMKSATQRTRGLARPRQGGFQTAAGERYIGDVTHQPTGALAPGNQLALGPGQPGALGAATTAGALAPGPFVMPSGPRPAGPAPTPLALPAQTGSAAPLGPARSRGRQQAFGQMKFGET